MMKDIKPKMPMSMVGPHKMEEKPIYPSFRIELQHLPEAKNWKVGEEYTLTLKLKMSGLSISRYQNDAEFEIHGVEVESKSEDAKDKEDEED